MSVSTPEELRALQAAGAVVAETIRAMRRAVAPGVSTAELDAIAGRVFARAGARSGPQHGLVVDADAGDRRSRAAARR